MKLKVAAVAILLLSLISIASLGLSPAQAQAIATPTYDPFGEPPLPQNPTQLENGQHLYWRHCMPCHGDAGQGLTDDFRILWEDHQNCWGSGCHAGHATDEGFPIPTIVPALAGVNIPTRYTPDSLFDYLRATHPPQDPGLLSDDDYRALVAFLYHLNEQTVPAATAALTSSPIPSFTSTPQRIPLAEPDSPLGLWPVIGLAAILTALILLRQMREGG